MKQLKLIIAAIIILFGTAVYAQPEDIKETADNYIPDFSSDSDMKPLETRKDFSLSYGAFVTSMYIDSLTKSDSGDTELSSSLTISKIWLKTTFLKNFGFYARGKDSYLKIIDNKVNGTKQDTKDDNVLDLDAGYFSWATDNNMLQISIGRKLYNIGTGLVFSGNGDGGEIGLYSKIINLNAFGAYTGFLNKDANPYNLSTKDFNDGAKRIFAGGTVSKTIFNQEIYLLGMYQMDKGKDESSTVKTKYDSLYYGAGLQGILLSAQYYAEYVMEQGQSYLNQSDQKKDIKAQAGNFGLNYYFDIPLKPAILLSYSFGSGDNSKEDVKGPNQNQIGNDTGFIYFGNFVGGFALRPYLSNIHVYRGGFSLNPLSFLDSKLFNRMSVIAKYSYYKKWDSAGAISDVAATENKSYIGDGYDLSFRWKIFYDCSVFANYGLFRPGDAYPDTEKNRTFIMGGINLMI